MHEITSAAFNEAKDEGDDKMLAWTMELIAKEQLYAASAISEAPALALSPSQVLVFWVTNNTCSILYLAATRQPAVRTASKPASVSISWCRHTQLPLAQPQR